MKDTQSALAVLQKEVNTPFNGEQEHVAFYIVTAGEKSFFAMMFDHRLFDARGADTFLGIIQKEFLGANDCSSEVSVSEPSHLRSWRKHMQAGFQIRHSMLAGRNRPVRILPLPQVATIDGFNFTEIFFTFEQSAAIMKKAEDTAGYLMLMPYLLSVSVLALHKIFTRHGIAVGDYSIPVTVDMRQPGHILEKMFFNHWSLFNILVEGDDAGNLARVVQSIKKQLYEQVSSNFLKHFQESSYLMRGFPLPVLSRLMRRQLNERRASFSFSYLGETAYPFNEFMGMHIDNIFHMPRVVMPPGCTIHFNHFCGKFNVVLSYAQGLLDGDDLAVFTESLCSAMDV